MAWMNRKKPPPIRSLIGEGMIVKGNLQFIDGLRVDGEIHGDVVAGGDKASIVVISEKARVNGMVSAGHVIINGEVHGPVVCSELLELQPRARVCGDVRYQALEMHQGAIVQGALTPMEAEKPPLMLAASNSG
jgi:cytoskeletal protein CcmA (bactofilin family)